MDQQPNIIFQITDQHLFCDKEASFLGIKPYHSFMKTLEMLKTEIARQKPQLVIFTGDTSQDRSKEPYQYVADAVKQLACDAAWIPGNHDNLLYAKQVLSTTSILRQKSFIFNDWKIILLNSHWPKHVEGKLSADELTFLNQALQSAREKYVIIFIHHHVVPVKCWWLDNLMLTNAEEMLALLDQHENIKAVFCGHIHQDNIQSRHKTKFISTPSTCIQFAKQTDHFTLDSLMPGYRRIELHANGTFNTHVVRIEHDLRFVPDLESRGY